MQEVLRVGRDQETDLRRQPISERAPPQRAIGIALGRVWCFLVRGPLGWTCHVALEPWMRARLARQGGGGHEVAIAREVTGNHQMFSTLSYFKLPLVTSLAHLRMRLQYLCLEQNRAERVYEWKRRSKKQLPAGQTAGRPGVSTLRVLDMSEGGNEGMRPVRRSPEHTDHDAPSLEVDAESIAISLETVPAECPGIFIEQPLERWSPRDLIVGVFRLVRWTRLATS